MVANALMRSQSGSTDLRAPVSQPRRRRAFRSGFGAQLATYEGLDPSIFQERTKNTDREASQHRHRLAASSRLLEAEALLGCEAFVEPKVGVVERAGCILNTLIAAPHLDESRPGIRAVTGLTAAQQQDQGERGKDDDE